jgi:class 3 adenylate cyclase/tetratricopeptide (TPR) repeat protein
VQPCPSCRAQNADEAHYCQACGSPLAAPGLIQEERKLVSVLFVDLVGSTARADRADPEDVRDTLRVYFDRCRAQVERYGGTVEKFIGDAVVAVFGAPTAHGDDAERAVRCGLDVLSKVSEVDAEHPGLELAARGAVATGEAVVTLGTGHRAGEALATGDVVNTASRLQSAAPPGRLIVDGATHRASRRAIRFDPIEPVQAKGKRDAVEAWLAVGLAERPGADTAPMVGRDREMELLTTIWRRSVDEHRPHLVTVLGSPGMGKSRITREFAARVEAAGGRMMTGRCLPYAEQSGYQASGDQLRRASAILESDPPPIARQKLGRTVESALPLEEVVDVSRYLSLLLGLGLDDPTDDRLPLFYAMRRMVEALAAQQPTVLAFEDIQWADASQLDLIEYLASHVREAPVLFLALARPELLDTRSSWGTGLLAHSTIPLEPLAPEHATRMALALLNPTGDLSSIVDRLVEVAGGNPLFVEELSASLQEGAGDAAALPTNVLGAIAARIDILPADQRSVLLDASVIGKTFWRGALRAISDVEDVDAALDALEARDLVRRAPRSRVEGDTELSFKHMLIREVAYGTLPRGARKERHAGIARHLEAAAAERIREVASVLAHHWREAGEPRRAAEYLVMAAERAREGWAKEEAITLYAEALELVGDSDPALRTRIRLQRTISLIDLTEFDRADAELTEIMPDLRGRDELEGVLARARCLFWLERTDEAFECAARVGELAERLAVRDAVGPGFGYGASAHMMAGTLEQARELGDRALESWVPGTRPFDHAVLMELHSETTYWMGDYERSEELARISYEMAGDIHHVEPLLRGGAWRGLALIALGRHEEGLALHAAIIERARDLGAPKWAASTFNYSSLAFRDVFDLKEARRRNEEAIELVRRHGQWGMPGLQGAIDLLFTDLLEGDVGSAQRGWPALWEEAINGKAWRPWLGGGRLALVRALIADQAETPYATAELAQDAIERARKSGRRKYETAGRVVLGSALVDLGRGPDGVAELRAAVAVADELISPPGRWQARAALARALYATGDDEGAEASYRDAAEVIRGFAATLAPQRSASLLGAEPVREILAAAR